MPTSPEARDPQGPEKIRQNMKALSPEDKVVFNERQKPLEVVECGNHRIVARGPQGGKKFFFPNPEGNVKSGDNPSQWRASSKQPDRVWFFERVSDDDNGTA